MDGVCRAWLLIAKKCGRRYGVPLPQQVLQIGDPERGWFVELNNSPLPRFELGPYIARVRWGGFPAGRISPTGGYLAVGEAANEETLIAWLEGDGEGGDE